MCSDRLVVCRHAVCRHAMCRHVVWFWQVYHDEVAGRSCCSWGRHAVVVQGSRLKRWHVVVGALACLIVLGRKTSPAAGQ